MEYYKIMTLDAAAILANGIKTGDSYRFDFDLNEASVREKLVIKVENHADCAMFHQIRMVAGKNGKPDNQDIFKELVFLDFSAVFSDKVDVDNEYGLFIASMSAKEAKEEIEKRGSCLMEKGLVLTLRGERSCTVFYPFDKSASMSRECSITFINSKIADGVDERVRMGLDFSKISLVISKYYAYRGLLMTNGKRITDLELDQDSVIVIADDEIPVITSVVTCNEKNVRGNTISLINDDGSLMVIDNKKIQMNVFDGEGIISKEYAEKINKELGNDGSRKAYSFQIRMPFTKGVLHTVSFKEFIAEQLEIVNLDGIKIKDVFGIERDLSRVEIILTESMFKCKNWFRKYADEYSKGDPVREYFDRFREYDHSLYISNTSLNLDKTDEVKLNYQFLNTLDINKNELEDLVNNHYAEARDLPIDADKARKALIRRQEKEDAADDWDEEGIELPAWKYALIQNSAFIYDPYIKEKIKSMSKSMTDNALLGRINVRGALCYLSRDLLSFLIHVIKQLSISRDDKEIIMKRLIKQCLRENKFYLPNYQKHDFNKTYYYGILRSPHLSRNEQCALQPFCPDENSIYEKYFGLLSGVIMVPYKSIVPAALGGADFDGDMVKLITDDTVNKAIIRGAYEKTAYDSKGKHYWYDRKFPIADIPKLEIRSDTVKGRIDYEQLKRTFSNKVGHISNKALIISGMEYFLFPDDLTYSNWSALCTIATGLEIDSVKTGVRPEIGIIDSITDGISDPFLGLKYGVDRGLLKQGKLYVELKEDKDNTEYYSGYVLKGKVKRKQNNVLTAYPPTDMNGLRPIDLLSYLYLKELCNRESISADNSVKREARDNMFTCELGSNTLRDSEIALSEELKKTIYAFRRFNKITSTISTARRKADENTNIGRIKMLLHTEYDAVVDRLAISKVGIDEAISLTLSECEELIKDSKKAYGALEKLKKRNWREWIFTEGYTRKKSMLSQFIDAKELSETAFEILCDSYDNGYHILKFVLSQINNELQKNLDESDWLERFGEPEGEYDKKLFNDIYSVYDIKASKSTWFENVKDKCRDRVAELFDGDMNHAAKVLIKIAKECDKNHSFFWEMFTSEEIKDLIIHEEKTNSEENSYA